MTEEQWLAATEPQPMLMWLEKCRRLPERKARLFAAECFTRILPLLKKSARQRVVQTAERYADGQDQADVVLNARSPAAVPWNRSAAIAAMTAAGVAGNSACARVQDAIMARRGKGELRRVAGELGIPLEVAHDARDAYLWVQTREQEGQDAVLRCLIGNPFQPTIPIPHSVLAWNDGTVVKIAQRIYDDRDWSLLPILADALEDAGCSDQSILEHLRGPGPHCRGCHVVDLILGRK